jgi:hypothetical protein
MPDTRTQVLDEIMGWVRGDSVGGTSNNIVSGDSNGSCLPRIYWLNGMAGTGKSTVARTIARRCLAEGRLGASFFFSRGGGELETARTFVTSITVQLAHLPASSQLPADRGRPELRAGICDAVRAQPDIAQKALVDQWRQLVLPPCERLRAIEARRPQSPPCMPLIIVVDALDECRDTNEIDFVIALLSETSGLAAAGLQIFLTRGPRYQSAKGSCACPRANDAIWYCITLTPRLSAAISDSSLSAV